MNLRIDRELPVPFGIQLRGLIEYGIACGELASGSRLPSVRDLAASLGLAPMTVSQVYKELKASGLIEGRAGTGTFVAAMDPGDRPTRLTTVRDGVDRLIAEARALGVPPLELQRLFNTRLLAAAGSGGGSLRVTLVGLFQGATRDYARAVEARLRAGESVEAVTLEELRAGEKARLRAGMAHLVLTFAHIRAEVAQLLPAAAVRAVSFIPGERTRSALAGLDPRASVCLVSTFGAFLPLMKAGVRRFAPHIGSISAAALDTTAPLELNRLLEGQDVVVYATGAEPVLGGLVPGVRAIEFRHMPDPVDLERSVLPLLDRLRANLREPAPPPALLEEMTP
jgi:DNA-binding transcriptional regulator YhcF (GntR family)